MLKILSLTRALLDGASNQTFITPKQTFTLRHTKEKEQNETHRQLGQGQR
jgi:hypothetical protein